MKLTENGIHYTIAEVADMCNKKYGTFYKIVKIAETEGIDGFDFPTPVRIGSRRFFTVEQAEKVKEIVEVLPLHYCCDKQFSYNGTEWELKQKVDKYREQNRELKERIKELERQVKKLEKGVKVK